MHRIDTPGAVPPGLFTPPNPQTGQQAVVVSSDWLNDLQENIAAVIAAGGVPLTKGRSADLLQAVLALITTNEGAGSGPGSTPAQPVDQVGPYGMPTRAGLPTPDLNGLIKSGFYAAPAGTANIPAGAGVGVVVSAGNTADVGDGAQIYVATATGGCWLRARSGGAWGAWTSLTAAANASLAMPGWRWTPDGFLEQWGIIAGSFPEGVVALSWPVLFDSPPFGLVATVENPAASIYLNSRVEVVSLAADSGQVLVNRGQSSDPNIPGFRWRVWGKSAAYPSPNTGAAPPAGGGGTTAPGDGGGSTPPTGGSGGVTP